jgi:hypothetical protein
MFEYSLFSSSPPSTPIQDILQKSAQQESYINSTTLQEIIRLGISRHTTNILLGFGSEIASIPKQPGNDLMRYY